MTSVCRPSFVHVISEITEGGSHDKKENNGTEDDGDLNPFLAGDKGEAEEKDISGKGDKDGDEECVLKIKREVDVIVPDGKEHDSDDQECEYPPDDFC